MCYFYVAVHRLREHRAVVLLLRLLHNVFGGRPIRAYGIHRGQRVRSHDGAEGQHRRLRENGRQQDDEHPDPGAAGGRRGHLCALPGSLSAQ